MEYIWLENVRDLGKLNEKEAEGILKGVRVQLKDFDAKWIHHLVFWAVDIHGNEISWCQRYGNVEEFERAQK